MTLGQIKQQMVTAIVVFLIFFLPGCYAWKKAKDNVENLKPVHERIIERYRLDL